MIQNSARSIEDIARFVNELFFFAAVLQHHACFIMVLALLKSAMKTDSCFILPVARGGAFG